MAGADKLDKRGGGAEFLAAALGPFGSLFKDLEKAFISDPSTMNRLGIVMPNVAKTWVKAIDEHYNGVLYPSGGKVLYDKETNSVRDQTTGELLTRLMGAMPSAMSSNKELHYMQKDKENYWKGRRNQLMAQNWEATMHHDREAMADVKAAIREFNATSDRALRITPVEQNASVKKHKANAAADTKRTTTSKRFKGTYQEMADLVDGEDD
jgi:hypothetical protein